MYYDQWGNAYKTMEEAKAGVLKQFNAREVAAELYYHIDIDRLLEWCIGNADFHKQFKEEFEETVNELCDEYISDEEV